MNRREAALALLSMVAAPRLSVAQTERRVRRIGYFSLTNPQAEAAWLAAFHAGTWRPEAQASALWLGRKI